MVTTETLTVLVTDLVDSTAIASRLGPDDAEVFRRQHFTLLRRAVAAAGGSEVRGTGDGLLVVFPAATAALACAVDIQRRIDRVNRRSAQPAMVRIGLAAGDLARADPGQEGRDTTGRAIADAEVLCAAAGGGRILVSRAVQLLGRHRQELSWGDPAGVDGSAAGPAIELRWSPFAPGEGSPVPLPESLAGQRSTGFAGRADERAKVSAAFELVAAGERQVVLLAGEPGIGKTRVAAECAHELLAEGAVVAFGRCDEHLGQPFHLWVECLTHLVTHMPPELVAAHHDSHGGELARLVPLGPPGRPATPPARSADAETERYLLHAAVLDLLGRAAELGPVVLVLDDLHWADTPSLQLLVHLVRTGPAVLVVATFRDSDAEPNAAWADTLAVLHREHGVHQLTLRGLDDVELATLLEDLAGHGLPEGAAVARALHQQTDGNPFFVRELLRHLVENGSITQGDDGAWNVAPNLTLGGLPVSVREVLGRRVARLGPQVEQSLTVAAVLGREVDLAVLAEVLGEPAPGVLDRLDIAVAARLLVEVPTPIGHYRFAHALVQHVLHDGLGATRRGTWHRRVAEVLEARASTDRTITAAELARHWEGAYPPDPERAIRYDLLAGDHALELLAPADAVHWFGRALHQLDAAAGDTVARATALVGLGEAQRELGDAAFRTTLLDAAALAQRAGTTPVLVRAALANHRGFASSTGVVDTERVAVLEAALDRPGEIPAAERARLLSQLATELIYAADWDRRLALADEALAAARLSGDPATVAEVLQARGNTLHHPSTLADRRSGSAEALGLATTLDDPALEFWCHIRCAVVALESFDRDAVDTHLAASRAIAQRAGLPRLHWPLTWYEVTTAVLDGDLDAAERGLVRVLEVGRQTGQPDTSAIYGALALGVRDLQGRLGELVPLLEQVVAERPGVPGFRAELARAHLEQGERGRALELLATETTRGFAGPLNSSWLSGMVLWADAAARLEEPAGAKVLAERLAPYHDQFVFNAVSSIGAVGTALGLLHTTLGEYDVAEAHLRTAANGLTRLRASSYLARNRLAAVRLLGRRGAAGDVEAGRRAGEVLVALAAERGFVALERDARELLVALAGEVGAPQGAVTAP
jgi:hypothetical protein